MDENSAAQALALFHQGARYLESAEWSNAEQRFRAATALDPGFAEAHANLGYAREIQGDADSAEKSYRKAIDLKPEHPTTHLNLGALLALQKRLSEAEVCYAAALALEPDSSAVWSNLGVLNLNLKREESAELCLRHAIALDANNAKARFNLAYLQLRRGNLEEGWDLLEARDGYRALQQHLNIPSWNGERLAGKSLLVVCEAGHGDTLHFCRYIPWLKTQGVKRINLWCPPALKTLLETLEGVDEIKAKGEDFDLLKHDYWMPLLSAPKHAQTRADTIPARLPYLKSNADLRAHWAARLPLKPGMRVGITWKGNPAFENDKDRSLQHLNVLKPLWAVPGIQWVSLQKGSGELEPAEVLSSQPTTDIGSALNDFANTAAVIDQLDLVISVDTAVAHLAGALAKPCWVLLPWYMTDWRWGDKGELTPWYPGVMRLFRQPNDGDWASVIQLVSQALREHVAAQ